MLTARDTVASGRGGQVSAGGGAAARPDNTSDGVERRPLGPRPGACRHCRHRPGRIVAHH
ncbi:hypothetical protein GCM10010532_096930 [Dactylosporangium siamense]